MYVTPSGWRKTIIHPEHMIKIKLYDNMGIEAMEILDDHAKPSGELEMHDKLQRYHKGTRAVVHLHPTNIIAAMFAGWDLQDLASRFPEVSQSFLDSFQSFQEAFPRFLEALKSFLEAFQELLGRFQSFRKAFQRLLEAF